MHETHNATNIFNAIWKVGLEKDALLLQCGLQCSARVTLQNQLMHSKEPPLLIQLHFGHFGFPLFRSSQTNSDPARVN